MARTKTRTLTELELRIMKVIWRKKEATVGEIQRLFKEEGKPLALPSIRTMLGILQDKGYVTRRADGRHHVYSALVSQDEARRSILADLIDRAFDGSASGLVAAMIGSRMVSKKEVDEVKRLIGRFEKETGK
jgi:predicted transcriptional regulator